MIPGQLCSAKSECCDIGGSCTAAQVVFGDLLAHPDFSPISGGPPARSHASFTQSTLTAGRGALLVGGRSDADAVLNDA